MPASCGKRLKATWAAVRIAEVLQQFYTQVLKKLESGKGRKSLHQHGIMAFWRSLSEKLSKHEDCARAVLEKLENQISAVASSQPASQQLATTPSRRRRKKMPATAEVEDAPASESNIVSGNPFQKDSGFVGIDVPYKYKLDGLRSRRYGTFQYRIWAQHGSLLRCTRPWTWTLRTAPSRCCIRL